MLGNPTVLIGGFPLPDLLDVLGAGLEGLKKLGDALGQTPTVKKLLAKVGLCNDPGEPINSHSGAIYNDYEDFRDPGGFTWERHYDSGWHADDGPLGHGFRHFYDRRLTLLRTRALYETHDGERISIPRSADGGFVTGEGFTLTARRRGRYELLTDRDELLLFEERATVPPSGRLARYSRAGVEVHLQYDGDGRLLALSDVAAGAVFDTRLRRDGEGRIAEVRRGRRGQGDA